MIKYNSVSECVKENPDKTVLTNDDGTFTPIAPVVIIETLPPVSAWQLRKALNATGLRADVENAVTASRNQDIVDGWEYAIEFERNNPLILSLAESLGKSKNDLDAIWNLAASL